jgi:hypothetical protein
MLPSGLPATAIDINNVSQFGIGTPAMNKKNKGHSADQILVSPTHADVSFPIYVAA